MLVGQYLHTIDSKGRVFVPAKYRSDLQGELIIVKGLDKCLVLYNEEQWNMFIKKLESFGEIEMKSIKRFILGSAFNTELDSQGRIVIPQVLREKVNIDKDVMFLGQNNCVELWRPELIEEVNENADTDAMTDILRKAGF